MAVRRALLVYGALVAVLVVASAQRLTSLAFPAVPRAMWMPFVRPLISAALEMALLAAVPAAALAGRVSGLSFRFALGLSGSLTVATAGAAALCEPVAAAPGEMAQQLVDSSRESCPSTPGRRVEVPLVGLTWSCPSTSPARVSGRLPSLPRVRYSAASVRVSPDLREVELAGLEVSLPPRGERLGLRASVKQGRIRGMSPWGRPAGRPLGTRLLVAGLAGLVTTLVALLLQPRFSLRWPLAALWALAGGFVSLFCERQLDRFGISGVSYWLASFSGALTVGVLALLLTLLRRAVRRWRSSVAGPAG